MTKRNLTLGTASGKLGSVVYFRRRGQQIARVLVSKINDRRSIAQCRQRARFANSVALWRLLRPYIGEAWRGVSRYGSPENAFYHHNRGFVPTCSRGMSRAGYAFPNLGIVTYGSLPVDVPLVMRPVMGTASYTGGLPFSILAQGVVTPPTDVVSLFNILQMSSTGIEDSDVIHIISMAYGYSDSLIHAVSAAEQYAPKVYHVSLSKSLPSTSLSLAAPWLRVDPGVTDDDEQAVGFDLVSSFYPPTPSDGYVGYVLGLFVERPRNPLYSRYSRSRFLANNTIMSDLSDLCRDTSAADIFAETFRNV